MVTTIRMNLGRYGVIRVLGTPGDLDNFWFVTMDLLGAVGYSKTVISHPSKYFSSIPKKFIQRKNIMLCDILSTYYCVSAKGIQRFLELDAQHPTLQPTRHEKCKEIGKILVTAQKKWGALLNKKR